MNLQLFPRKELQQTAGDLIIIIMIIIIIIPTKYTHDSLGNVQLFSSLPKSLPTIESSECFEMETV